MPKFKKLLRFKGLFIPNVFKILTFLWEFFRPFNIYNVSLFLLVFNQFLYFRTSKRILIMKVSLIPHGLLHVASLFNVFSLIYVLFKAMTTLELFLFFNGNFLFLLLIFCRKNFRNISCFVNSSRETIWVSWIAINIMISF